jgi:hypothetical protein
MDVSGIEGVSPVAKAAYEFLEILARQHIRDRSHREPTNKRVNQQVTRWIEEDLIIPIVLVQIKRFLEIAKHWESSAFDQHLLRYFSQATLLSRKRGRPRRRRHRRLLPLLPMATAQGERKAELDYLKPTSRMSRVSSPESKPRKISNNTTRNALVELMVLWRIGKSTSSVST